MTIKSFRIKQTLLIEALYLYIVSALKCDILNDVCGRIDPIDPNATVGKPLSLTCSLNKTFMDHYNVSSVDIFFKIKPSKTSRNTRPLDDAKYQRIDAESAILNISNVTFEHGVYSVSCFVKTRKDRIKVTHEIMYVGYLPETPSLKDVYISNWERLVIKWKTRRENPFFKTSYTAWYNTSTQGGWSKCVEEKEEEQEDEQCIVPVGADHFNIYAKYLSVKVNGSNYLGNSTTDILMAPLKSLVIPSKVKNVSVSLRRRSIQITWDSPKPENMRKENVMIKYEIIYGEKNKKRSEDIEKQIDIAAMENIEITLTDLRPYREYIITIRCQSYGSKKWSEKVTLNNRTKEDKPEAAPVVTPGSYFVKVGERFRDVYLFWKDIPDGKSNGRITNYRFTIINGPELKKRHIAVTKPTFSYKLENLALDKRYLFFINANNSMGYNDDLNLKSINVPKQDEILHMPEFKFVAIENESRVEVTWQPFKEKEVVTIYWCTGKQLQSPACTDEIKWEIKDGSKGFAEIKWNITKGQLFGSSIRKDNITSGISWTQCVYNNNEAPDVPKADVLRITAYTIVLSLRKPDCLKSRADIHYFKVRYCPLEKTSDKCSEEEKFKKFKVGLLSEYTLKDLQPGTRYMLKFASLTRLMESYSSSIKEETLPLDKFKIAITVIAVIGVLILLVIIICVIMCKYKKMHKRLMFKTPPAAERENRQNQEMADMRILRGSVAVANQTQNHNSLHEERRESSNDSDDMVRTDVRFCVAPFSNQENTHNNPCSQEELDNYQHRLIIENFSDNNVSVENSVTGKEDFQSDTWTPLIINPESFKNTDSRPVKFLGVKNSEDTCNDEANEVSQLLSVDNDNIENGYSSTVKSGDDICSYAKVEPVNSEDNKKNIFPQNFVNLPKNDTRAKVNYNANNCKDNNPLVIPPVCHSNDLSNNNEALAEEPQVVNCNFQEFDNIDTNRNLNKQDINDNSCVSDNYESSTDDYSPSYAQSSHIYSGQVIGSDNKQAISGSDYQPTSHVQPLIEDNGKSNGEKNIPGNVIASQNILKGGKRPVVTSIPPVYSEKASPVSLPELPELYIDRCRSDTSNIERFPSGPEMIVDICDHSNNRNNESESESDADDYRNTQFKNTFSEKIEI